jgi:hypothetical protein
MGTYAFIEETTRKTEVEPSGSLGHWKNHMRGTQDVGFRAVRHGYYTRIKKEAGVLGLGFGRLPFVTAPG